MSTTPKWFMPVAVVALIWNLLGCAAYLADVMAGPEAVAAMTEAQQAMYAARTSWMVAATAIAVWFGAAGSLGLVLRKRWALPLLLGSLLGIVVQDLGLFVISDAASYATAETVAMALQGLVLIVGVALVMVARKASAEGWIS